MKNIENLMRETINNRQLADLLFKDCNYLSLHASLLFRLILTPSKMQPLLILNTMPWIVSR